MDYPLDLVTRKPDKEQAGAAILSAARLPQVAEKFLQSSGRLQGLPAAVADLGDRLYGDYTRFGSGGSRNGKEADPTGP